LCQFRSVTRLICPDVATLLVLAFLYLNHPTVNLSTYQLFLTDDFVYWLQAPAVTPSWCRDELGVDSVFR